MSQDLGSIGVLPVDILPVICQFLSVEDLLNFRNCNKQIGNLVECFIFPTMVDKVKVQIFDSNSVVEFTHRSNGMVSVLDMNKSNSWKKALMMTTKLRDVEVDFSKDASTSQIFNILGKSQFRLNSLKVNIREGQKKSVEKVHRLYNNCVALVKQHRSTLHHLEASTVDGQQFLVEIDPKKDKTRLEYKQGDAPKNNELMEHSQNYYLAYNMFHTLIEKKPSSDVTLVIDSNFDANLALQKAFQIAIPHSNRKCLKHLTIEFGESLQKVAEEDVKKVLLRHVDEFHFTTPNLHHFTCHLPHDSIDLSLEFLNNEIRDQVKKTRKSPTPYNPTVCLRPVSCK